MMEQGMWEIEPGKQDSLAWAGRGWEGGGGKVAPACLFLGSSREKFDYGEVGGWRGRKEQRVNNKIYSKNMAQSSLSSPGCFQLCIVVTAVFPEWGRRLVSGVRAAGFTFHRCKSLLWRMKIPARSFSRPPGSCCVRGQHGRKRARNENSTEFPRKLALQLRKMFSNNDEAVINKKLPKELLLRIFSFLDVVTLCRCAQVSRGRVVENISKRCGGFLRKLSLRGCQGVGDNALRTFAQNCRNIEVLNLNGCTKITDATCTSLSKFCSKLRHLDLASCTSITNLSLKALSEGCPLLEQLNISWCDQVTKDGIQALVRGCGGLKALFLKGCTQLEDEALKYIGAHCPELVTLNLQTCLQITDDGLITICRGCHKLQSLCASGCSNITDAILNALGQNCPRLRILEVARCSQLTDVGFTTLARNCHELEKMDLEECVQITDSTLIQLSIHCPRLQVLSLSHCELITDDGIRHLGNGACAHDRLEVIELDNCPLITDASLEHLKSCHSLERIELYDCQQITRAGIKRLRTHLPNIKVHAYFAPVTPPPSVGGSRQRFCRCCIIL
ncbi:F-box/LRR-repeat protein 20 isoform 2-T3 [Morphnus guianensis]